ncbi:hypothetical protein BpHYR1_024190 [Brachionus plicatilis]|uniref:Uncharacterized protein n=1 Tax=Brachionus plicatilis TaxID=10195 RepID=A0A3M7PMG1_BRAPC|nr:hypothetical protein BpHYR1_024190 [Brachionus plicatilis]
MEYINFKLKVKKEEKIKIQVLSAIAEASAILMHNIGYCLESFLNSKDEKGEKIAKSILIIANDMRVDKRKVQEPLKYLDITRVAEFFQSFFEKCEKDEIIVNGSVTKYRKTKCRKRFFIG